MIGNLLTATSVFGLAALGLLALENLLARRARVAVRVTERPEPRE